MLISRLKNLLIVALIFLSIYLTGQLWFANYANKSVFSAVSAMFIPQIEQTATQIPQVLKPFRIITNHKNSASIIQSDLSASTQKKVIDEIITTALKKGEFEKVESVNMEAFLSEPCFFYDYSFSVPVEFFVGVFNQKSVNLSAKAKNFNLICVNPSSSENKTLRVSFINYENNTACTYKVLHEELNNKAIKLLEDKQDDKNNLVFEASELSKMKIFSMNNFIPNWKNEDLEYNVVKVLNPYASNGDLTLPSIEREIDYLFESTLNRDSGTPNNIYTFSNENTVIKYYPTNVLEYANYATSDAKSTLVNDYFIALDFIKRDRNVVNEFYLMKIETQDELNVFYFGYVINNYALRLSESIISDIKMDAPIKVTIEGGKVSKYKKIPYNFEIDTQVVEKATVSFTDSLNNILPDNQISTGAELESVSLSYKIEDRKSLKLSWFMDMFGRTVSYPANFN